MSRNKIILFLFIFFKVGNVFAETPLTQITSDGKLVLDYKNYIAEFFVNVLVKDAGGTLRADYLNVFFTKSGNEIEKMIAKGHVVIDQNEQHSESGCAEFFSREGKIILTEKPIIRKGDNEYSADVITIFTRTNQVNFEPSARIVIRKSGINPLPSPEKVENSQEPEKEIPPEITNPVKKKSKKKH